MSWTVALSYSASRTCISQDGERAGGGGVAIAVPRARDRHSKLQSKGTREFLDYFNPNDLPTYPYIVISR